MAGGIGWRDPIGWKDGGIGWGTRENPVKPDEEEVEPDESPAPREMRDLLPGDRGDGPVEQQEVRRRELLPGAPELPGRGEQAEAVGPRADREPGPSGPRSGSGVPGITGASSRQLLLDEAYRFWESFPRGPVAYARRGALKRQFRDIATAAGVDFDELGAALLNEWVEQARDTDAERSGPYSFPGTHDFYQRYCDARRAEGGELAYVWDISGIDPKLRRQLDAHLGQPVDVSAPSGPRDSYWQRLRERYGDDAITELIRQEWVTDQDPRQEGSGQGTNQEGDVVATTAEKDNWYSYHPPTTGQANAYTELRAKAREFADLFDRYAPASADATAAHRKLRDTVMAMNQAIACNGLREDV